MSRFLIPAILFSLALFGTSCGPEAEVGVHFSRLPAPDHQVRQVNSPVDSIAPDVDVDYLTGKFDPASHPGFEAVSSPYTRKTGMFLRQETFAAFKNMWAAAKKDGVELFIVSSTRSFTQQKNIWEGKWTRFAAGYPKAADRAGKILEYSAMPGASRHHWGTDIDLNDLNNASFEPGGKYEKAYRWLQKNAAAYGFCQPYSPKGTDRPNGYNEEKWHWSYLPLATPLLKQYLQNVDDSMFTAFSGADAAPALHIVEHYVAGINHNCE